MALERKIYFLNAPAFGRFPEFRFGTPVPAAVHGNLRTIDHFFLLNFWYLPASACRRLSAIFPKKANPAADRQGAKTKISGNLKKARGRPYFCIFDEQKKEMHIFMTVPVCPLVFSVDLVFNQSAVKPAGLDRFFP
jgi:hypothetical protein